MEIQLQYTLTINNGTGCSGFQATHACVSLWIAVQIPEGVVLDIYSPQQSQFQRHYTELHPLGFDDEHVGRGAYVYKLSVYWLLNPPELIIPLNIVVEQNNNNAVCDNCSILPCGPFHKGIVGETSGTACVNEFTRGRWLTPPIHL